MLNEVRRNKIIAEVTHEAQNKMDVSLKYFEDQNSLIETRLTSRVEELNSQLAR